ncbi:glycosyltransferase family 66 protein [Suillus brevipes Sb2]|nr:glycosyltransferase family 66 protein [Suillus brevipes Sb2]
MDLHFLIFLFPAGVVMCFRTLRDEHVFVIIYAVVASYFAGAMVRLMLTLTPVVCVCAAVALSSLMDLILSALLKSPPSAIDNLLILPLHISSNRRHLALPQSPHPPSDHVAERA